MMNESGVDTCLGGMWDGHIHDYDSSWSRTDPRNTAEGVLPVERVSGTAPGTILINGRHHCVIATGFIYNCTG